MTFPIDYNTVPVTGKYIYLDGTPAEGTVRFTGKILAVSDATDTIILPNTVVVELVNGEFSINLPATDDPDISPNGWTYSVEERFRFGGGRKFEMDVPISAAGTGIDMSEVAPSSPSNGDPNVYVTLTAFYDEVGNIDSDITTLSSNVAALESEVDAVEADLINKSDVGHTHPGSGGDVLLDPPSEQILVGSATRTWASMTAPYSAGDTNVDQWQFFAGHPTGGTPIKTTHLNGNNEMRNTSSLRSRVAHRVFEFPSSAGQGDGNTGDVWQVSTNPSNSANRIAIAAVRGTAAASLPGFLVLEYGLDSPNTTPGAWTAVTLGAATLPTSTYEEPHARKELAGSSDGSFRIQLKGRIQIPANTAFGTTLFTLPSGMHPTKTRGFSVRTGGTNLATIMEINSSGQASLIIGSGASEAWIYLDGISFVE